MGKCSVHLLLDHRADFSWVIVILGTLEVKEEINVIQALKNGFLMRMDPLRFRATCIIVPQNKRNMCHQFLRYSILK